MSLRRAALTIYLPIVSRGVVRQECGSHWCSREETGDERDRAGEGETGLIRARVARGFPLMFDSCVWAGFGRRSVREECEDA